MNELTDQILGLQEGDHLCLIYENDPAEQMPALIPFIKQGLADGERCIYIADDQTVDEVAEALQKSGVDVDRVLKQGSLLLWTRKEWRQPGDLDSERKAAQVQQFIDAARAAGFKGIRFAVEMTWTLGPDIDAARLRHWEATINRIFANFCSRISRPNHLSIQPKPPFPRRRRDLSEHPRARHHRRAGLSKSLL